MATSGKYNFALNKQQLITRTLQSINAIDFNDTPDSNDYSFASDMLNMMLEMWGIDGVHLFKRFEATLFPQYNQYIYQIGNVTGADHCCLTSSYVETTTTVAYNSVGISTITVTSTTGFVVGQNIGLEQDNQIRVWGTITSINTGASTITATFVTNTTAQAGNTVVAYNNLINRPLEILRGTTEDLKANNSEVTMDPLSYDEYFNMPAKNTLGRPNNFYYDRLINGEIPYSGTLYLYNNPYKAYQLINFTYADSLQNMLNNNDNFDLPQEWLLPIMTNLAALLAQYGYGKSVELPSLQATAEKHYLILKEFDNDTESLKITRDMPNYPNMLL